MRAVDVIRKKRDGKELTTEEIQYFISGFATGEIPDYQASAWAMAVVLKGMNTREITDLTLAMAYSGEILDLSSSLDLVVDKHSTGGVGDKTTLVVLPLVLGCGVPVGKMSGRGLGFSGGTLDKMESIPGFRTEMSIDEFLTQLKDFGLVLIGQTSTLAPADGKLYALRDVTATVSSLPLIASSIMSKKIAAGAQRIVLDVKAGLGAFLHTVDEATELGRLMVKIANRAGRKAVGLISDMNQPLGYAVGNALEVKEAIETLQGNGPADFVEHCLEVAAYMVFLADKAENVEDARQQVEKVLYNGHGWENFRKLVELQGGDVSYIDNPEKLPKAKLIETVRSFQSGYLSQVNARVIGEMSVVLGAGRMKKGDAVNHAVGIVVHHKVGDYVKAGDDLFTIHAHDRASLEEVRGKLLEAHQWSDNPVDPLPLFYQVIMD